MDKISNDEQKEPALTDDEQKELAFTIFEKYAFEILLKYSSIVSQFKEFLIGLTVATYAMGLICWEIYAFRNGLGYLTALNPIYFSSGIVFFVFMAITIFFMVCNCVLADFAIDWGKALKSKIDLPEYVSEFINAMRKKNNKIAIDEAFTSLLKLAIAFILYLTCIVVLFTVGIFLMALYFYLNIKFCFEKNASTLIVLLFIATGLTFYAVIRQVIATRRDLSNPKSIKRKTKNLILLLSGVVWSFVYILFIFPAIPQEFGGGRPQICYLDFDITKMSHRTVNEICYKDFSEYVSRYVDYKKGIKKDIIPKNIDEVIANYKQVPIIKYKIYRELKDINEDDRRKYEAFINQREADRVMKAQSFDIKRNNIDNVIHSDELQLWFDSPEYIVVRRQDSGEYHPETNVTRIGKNMFLSLTIHSVTKDRFVRKQENIEGKNKK